MITKIKRAFWNDTENRLRSSWRIVITWIGMITIFLPVQFLIKPLFPASWSKDQKIDILIVCLGIIATIVVSIMRVRLDKRSVASLGLTKNRILPDVAAGYFISAVLVLIILAVEVSFGWVTFELMPAAWPDLLSRALYTLLVTGLVVSWWENLFFVSYLFLNLRDGCGFWCAYIINCVIFGLAHGMNPNATVWALAGVMLIHSYEIFGFLRTGNLWLILGLHAGWNSFQGLAGFPVSGGTGNQIIAQVNQTPSWLGGGEFGPEAGLIVLLTSAIAFSLIFFYSKWVQRVRE